MYAVGNNRLLEIEQSKIKAQFESNKQLTQITMNEKLDGPNYLFISANFPEGPGSVQIFKFPFEKMSEVSAHARPISRMHLSNCGQFLLTAGEDGHLIIHDVKDRDPRGIRREKEIGIDYSDEILTVSTQIDELNTKKKTLENDNAGLTDKDGWHDMLELKKKDDEFAKIRED